MLRLLLLYALCLLSGLRLERRLSLNGLLARVIVVFTVAAAQLVLSVQGLSLLTWLTGGALLFTNALLTILIVGLTWRDRVAQDRPTWGALLTQARSELTARKMAPLAVLSVAVAVGSRAIACAIGLLMVPIGDTYHNEMPLFWVQNHTIAPFPVNNPRVTSVSFVSEALCLPGYMYPRMDAMIPVFSFLAAVLAIWLVFSLTRRIGCSFEASACAGAMTAGYTAFTPCDNAEIYLAALWFGASILFLMDSRPSAASPTIPTGILSCSILCFLMACGSKNSTIVLAPVYLLALAMVLGRSLWNKRTLMILVVSAAIALLCSGVAWNYISNRLWFGNSTGTEFLKATLSRDFRPRAVWTRLSRSTVLLLFDTVWIPKSAQHAYAAICDGTLHLLGAQQTLGEDDAFYGLTRLDMKPRKGMGLLGIVFFLPAVAVTAARWFRTRPPEGNRAEASRVNANLLLFLSLGGFVMYHVVLRWQSIGLLRLMPAFIIAGAPLPGLLLEKRWARVAALGLLVPSCAMFQIMHLGELAPQRNPAVENGVFKAVSRLQNNHARSVEYNWGNQAAEKLLLREDYSSREVYQKLFEGIPQPTVFGFVGGPNSASYYLFGADFRNKVVPLLDARRPTELLEPPENVEYLVFGEYDPERGEWALKRGWRPFFQVTDKGTWLLAVFKRPSLKPG
ncbi:MAG: hypothetical protein ABSA12_01710 [Verrucomicrobiia bacterium]